MVAQDYNLEVRVVNGGSAKGCTAVLECVAPTFMKDLVKVVSWLQEPGFYIYPSLQGGEYNKCLSTIRLKKKKKKIAKLFMLSH